MRRVAVLVAPAMALLVATTVPAGAVAKPDPALTPGATNVAVTQATITSTICTSGYAKTIRNVSSSTKRRVYREYHIAKADRSNYVIDHLIPLKVGGSNAIANLWPEPRKGSGGSTSKDDVESSLHSLVCSGKVTLAVAQQAIATNWTTALTIVTASAARDDPPTNAPCSPRSPAGNCYERGELCPRSLHNQTIQGAAGPLTCEFVNGYWRFE